MMHWIRKPRYRPTRLPSSFEWYAIHGHHKLAAPCLLFAQERELEKVNTFYLQKEAEVGSTLPI